MSRRTRVSRMPTVHAMVRAGAVWPEMVVARMRIADNPLARRPTTARRGEIGTVEDILPDDGIRGLLAVSFRNTATGRWRAAILVDPTEVSPLVRDSANVAVRHRRRPAKPGRTSWA